MENPTFEQPNRHYISRLMTATEKKKVVATEDIYDRRGIKLWASGRPISVSLKERLLAAKLKKPLELCIRIEDGLKPADITATIKRLFDEKPTFSQLAGEQAQKSIKLFDSMKLTGLPHLQLSTAAVDGSGDCQHAITTALVAALIALHVNAPESAVESVMMAGLVHDFGEMYLDSALLRGRAQLEFEEWRKIATHPRVGAVLLSECAHLPTDIVRTVQEHHERLDGTGYPYGLTGDKISPLGKILMIAEVLSAILPAKENPAARAMLAMRVVRNQFEPQLVSALTGRLRNQEASIPSGFDSAALAKAGQILVEQLRRCDAGARAIKDQASLPENWRELAGRTCEMCREVVVSLNASGVLPLLEGQSPELLQDSEVAVEIQVVVNELKWRARSLSRYVALTASRWMGGMEAFEPLVKELTLH